MKLKEYIQQEVKKQLNESYGQEEWNNYQSFFDDKAKELQDALQEIFRKEKLARQIEKIVTKHTDCDSKNIKVITTYNKYNAKLPAIVYPFTPTNNISLLAKELNEVIKNKSILTVATNMVTFYQII